MKNGLVNEEVTITHAWHLLHEVESVLVQIVIRLIYGLTIGALATRAHVKLLIDCGHVDRDKVCDVLGVS